MLDHVGIAVRSLHEAVKFYRHMLALPTDAAEEVASERVRVQFIPLGGPMLELLEPTAEDSPIARYIAKRGPGLHHITLAVSELDATLARLKAQGARLIDATPRAGARGSRIAFIHPASAHGVLVELKEAQRGGVRP